MAAAIVLLCALYSYFTTDFNVAGIERTVIAATLGLLGIAAVFVFPHFHNPKATAFWILLLCLAARLALIPAAPSDDINRYLWEGKLTAEGVSPYRGLAEDAMYESHRDDYWVKMNHKDRPTAYPPLAMQIFRGINSLGYSPLSYKWVFLALDLAVIALLLGVLAQLHRPLHWSLFYGLSPLTMLSFSAEAHFDVVMVAALVAALLAYSKRWFIACGVAVGIAVGVKLMAAVVAPILLWKAGRKGILAGLLTLCIPLLFSWSDLPHVFNALIVFGSGGGFNGPVYSIVEWLLESSKLATMVVALLYVVCWLMAFWLTLKNRVWSALLLALGGLLILSPIVHFWYLTWVLPLIVVRPRLSWISLSITFSLYFLVWHMQAGTGVWTLPLWAKWMFWVPFMIFLLAEARRCVPRFMRKLERKDRIAWSVVIPTYQVDPQQLDGVLTSIAGQTLQPSEVIIANAGDPPQANCPELALQIVQSDPGRGMQIKAGVDAATAPWVIVLHSDLILPANALENLTHALEANQQVIAGSLGQRFDHASAGLLLVEAMNEFRATTMQTSFGDQCQFFHRATAIDHGVLTEQKLMEDVEMSDRLNNIGENLYLANEGIVCARKWRRHSFCKRFFTIIEFMLRYRFSFSGNARLSLCERFYQRYYG